MMRCIYSLFIWGDKNVWKPSLLMKIFVRKENRTTCLWAVLNLELLWQWNWIGLKCLLMFKWNSNMIAKQFWVNSEKNWLNDALLISFLFEKQLVLIPRKWQIINNFVLARWKILYKNYANQTSYLYRSRQRKARVCIASWILKFFEIERNKQWLDTFLVRYISGTADYINSCKVCKVILILSHVQADVEWGFSASKDLLIESMTKSVESVNELYMASCFVTNPS